MATETFYKKGTIDAGGISSDGLTLTVTADSDSDAFLPSDGEVGRIIYITQKNTAQGRYRRIVDNTASTLTLDAPFGTSVFRGLTPSVTSDDTLGDATDELDVEAGDSFTISKTMAEVADQNADIEDISGTDALRKVYKTDRSSDNSKRWTIPSGVVVYDENIEIELCGGYDTSDNQIRFNPEPGSAVIFGRQNFGDLDDGTIVGWPSRSCWITETSRDLSSGNITERGCFHINGGYLNGRYTADYNNNSVRGSFYRYQGDSSFRMWNVTTNSRFAGRIGGRYSAIYNNTITNNTSRLGPFNPLSIGVFENNKFIDTYYGLYSYPEFSGNTEVQATSIQNIQQSVLYASVSEDTPANYTHNIINWSITEIQAAIDGGADLMNVAYNTNNTTTQTYRLSKDFKLDFTNADGSAIADTDDGTVMILNGAGNEPTGSPTTTDAGSVDSVNLVLYQRFVRPGATGPAGSLASFTKIGDYDWAVLYRGYGLISGSTDGDGPIGPIEEAYPRIPDLNSSIDTTGTLASIQARIAEIDALTELSNAQDLYDYSFKYKEDDMTMPTISSVGFSKSGDILTATTDSANITFSDGLDDALAYDEDTNTWTVDAGTDGYTGGIVSAATVTVNNTVQGHLTCATLEFSGTAPSTIIDTSEIVAGLVTLDAGTYAITGGADISALTINSSGGVVTIRLLDATGTDTLITGPNVVVRNIVDVTLQLNENYQSSRLSTFRWDGAASDALYLSGTKKNSSDTDVTITPNNATNSVLFSISVNSTEDLYLYIAYEGYEHSYTAAAGEPFITFTPNAISSGAIDFTEDPVDGSDDATLDGLTPTVGSDTSGTAFAAADDDIHIRIPTTGPLSSTTGNFERKFVWRATQTANWIDGVLVGYVPGNSWSYEGSALVLNHDDGSDEEARFLGNFTKLSGSGIIQFATRVLNGDGLDLRTTISSTSSLTEVRFAVNSAGASYNEVFLLMEDTLDERLLTEENLIRLGKLQTVKV